MMGRELDNIDLAPEQRKELHRLIQRYLPNTEVWAYGSRVRFSAKTYSDLDLVAFASPAQGMAVLELREAFEESSLPFRVDFFVWDEVPETFRKNIEKERVVLVEVPSEKVDQVVGGQWFKKTLGDVVELKRGYDLPKRKRQIGDVPIISSAGFSDTHVDAKVKGPGVVTGRYGTIGEVYYSNSDFWPLNTTLYVRDFKGNDEKFIYYFLQTIDFLQYSDKAAVPGVNRNHLHMANILFPSDVKVQKAIAHILGSLDEKIELNRQMNATLESMAQALFKSWFVDFDLVIDNALAAGNPIPEPFHARAETRKALGDKRKPLPEVVQKQFPSSFVFSEEMGWVPEGWEISTVGDEVETTGGGTPSTKEPEFWEGGTQAFCTPKDMSLMGSLVLMDTARYLTDAGVNKISSGQLPSGTVLMSSRAPIGYLAISDIPVSVNQGIIAMLPSVKYGSLFLLCWAHFNMGQIKDRANGSTFLEISKKNFRPIPFVVPDDEILEVFNKQAQAIYDKLLLVAEGAECLIKLRDTLLPKLLSGQLRIPDAEQMIQEAL